MKQLKKIKLLPLTDFDTLGLKIGTQKNINLKELASEKVKELWQTIHKIIGKNPRVIIANEFGEKKYVNTQVKGARDKNKIFSFPEPNPVCIYYSSGNSHLQISYEIKNKLFSEEQHFNANYHYDKFIQYFQETSEGVILLTTSLEGFINQLIPEKTQIEIDGIKRSKTELEWFDLLKKIRELIPILTAIDFQKSNGADYDNICLIIDLRNDLIHLKKSLKENITNYQQLFKRLVDLDHIACSDSIFTFVNTIIPDYFVEDN